MTFDDGYADNLEVAAPIAARYGIRPTLFVTTGILREGWRFPVDAWYAAIASATCRRGILSGFGAGNWAFDLARSADLARLIDGPEKRAYLTAPSSRQVRLLGLLCDTLEGSTDRTPRYLDATALRELEARGWYIGGHSRTHALLTEVSHPIQAAEIRGCHRDLAPVVLSAADARARRRSRLPSSAVYVSDRSCKRSAA